MNAILADEPGKIAPRRHYDLHFREGPRSGLVWRYRDAGITLTPAGMEWVAAGERRYTDYATIATIRIQTGHIPKAGYFGSCIITFRNGRDLTVTSLDSWGSPDPERLDDYAEFLQDLHARLGEEDKRRIVFLAGVTEGRQMAGKVAVVIGGAFFVLLPLGLLLLTGEIKTLLIALAGAAFVVPAFRTLKKNEPRTYNPDSLDEDLFPHT
jgi:hypothetical protein